MQVAKIVTNDVDRTQLFNVSSHINHKPSVSVAETYEETIKESTERVSKDDIDYIVAYLLERKDYGFCGAVIMEANTGFRIGDILSLRVCDLFKKTNGKYIMREYITLREQKGKGNINKKPRTTWLNQAVKTILEILVQDKAYDDFIFTSNGNRKSYFVTDKNGNLLQRCTGVNSKGREMYELIKTNKKYNDYGIPNKLAPYNAKSTAMKWRNISIALGIESYYRSHSLRKSYAYYGGILGQKMEQPDMYVSQSLLGHESADTTMKYYLALPTYVKKEIEKSLNLGLSALNLYLSQNGSTENCTVKR